MKPNLLPKKVEARRLGTLYAYEILDTMPERQFDDIAALASEICGTPIAAISLIDRDRQWFKASVGLEGKQTTREESFCQYTIAQDTVLEVEDALLDERFKSSCLVQSGPRVRFYAGTPLITPDGSAIGALCVKDIAPRSLTPFQRDALQRLARQVVDQLELRSHVVRLQNQSEELKLQAKQLKKAQRETEKAIDTTRSAIQELGQSRETLRRLVDQAVDAFFLVGLDGKFVSVNRAACESLGYSEAELLTMGIEDIEVGATPAQIAENIANRADGESITVQSLQLRKDGSTFPAEVRIGFIRIDATECMVAVSRDMTERERVLEELRKSEERFTLSARATSDVVWDLNLSTGNAWWSENYYRFFLEAGAEVKPCLENWIKRVHPDDKQAMMNSFGEALVSDCEQWAAEYRYLRADGTYAHVVDRAFVVRDGGGRAVRMIGALSDLTARKRMEQEERAREHAEKANRAKSEFLSRMSHELRTPLNAILGFTQLLEMQSPSAKQSEFLSQILQGGRHLLQLINEVLDLSRIETGNLSMSREPVCVAEVVSEAVNLVRPMAEHRDITIRTSGVLESSDYVMADRQRMLQVLINLLSNAVKYNVESGWVEVVSEPRDERIQIAVIDSGPGISPDMHDRVFMPFDRLGIEQAASVEGTGLGLALSKSLVEAMGGTIELSAGAGTHTTFRVELVATECPISTATATASVNVASHRPQGDLAVRRVLYIEDNTSNVTLMEHVLAAVPEVQLWVSKTGVDGLGEMVLNPPDLVLLDLDLPDISGLEILRRAKANASLCTIPIIVVSADVTPGRMKAVLDAGAKCYISKPFEIAELLLAIYDVQPLEVRHVA